MSYKVTVDIVLAINALHIDMFRKQGLLRFRISLAYHNTLSRENKKVTCQPNRTNSITAANLTISTRHMQLKRNIQTANNLTSPSSTIPKNATIPESWSLFIRVSSTRFKSASSSGCMSTSNRSRISSFR